jgi:hypothetical protein
MDNLDNLRVCVSVKKRIIYRVHCDTKTEEKFQHFFGLVLLFFFCDEFRTQSHMRNDEDYATNWVII